MHLNKKAIKMLWVKYIFLPVLIFSGYYFLIMLVWILVEHKKALTSFILYPSILCISYLFLSYFYAILSFKNFQYEFHKDSISILEGSIIKKSINLNFEKIKNVYIGSGILNWMKLFNLYTVEIVYNQPSIKGLCIEIANGFRGRGGDILDPFVKKYGTYSKVYYIYGLNLEDANSIKNKIIYQMGSKK